MRGLLHYWINVQCVRGLCSVFGCSSYLVVSTNPSRLRCATELSPIIQQSTNPTIHHSCSALLLRYFLPLWLRCRRLGCRRRFRLHHAHLLLVFLEEHCAARLAGFLLAGYPGTHFLCQI